MPQLLLKNKLPPLVKIYQYTYLSVEWMAQKLKQCMNSMLMLLIKKRIKEWYIYILKRIFLKIKIQESLSYGQYRGRVLHWQYWRMYSLWLNDLWKCTQDEIYHTQYSIRYRFHCFRYCVKGIVQRDLTGVETRLKRSVLMNYIIAKFAFWILKEHYLERSIKQVSAS